MSKRRYILDRLDDFPVRHQARIRARREQQRKYAAAQNDRLKLSPVERRMTLAALQVKAQARELKQAGWVITEWDLGLRDQEPRL